jgi:hypothetical protein
MVQEVPKESDSDKDKASMIDAAKEWVEGHEADESKVLTQWEHACLSQLVHNEINRLATASTMRLSETTMSIVLWQKIQDKLGLLK